MVYSTPHNEEFYADRTSEALSTTFTDEEDNSTTSTATMSLKQAMSDLFETYEQRFSKMEESLLKLEGKIGVLSDRVGVLNKVCVKNSTDEVVNNMHLLKLQHNTLLSFNNMQNNIFACINRCHGDVIQDGGTAAEKQTYDDAKTYEKTRRFMGEILAGCRIDEQQQKYNELREFMSDIREKCQ